MKLPEGIVAYLWTATGLVSLVVIVIGISEKSVANFPSCLVFGTSFLGLAI